MTSLPSFHHWISLHHDGHAQQVEMGLLLERRNGAFLLSSIGPCVVLLLLGHLSFIAFPLQQFTDRASTSLSLLIVVAALFSQAREKQAAKFAIFLHSPGVIIHSYIMVTKLPWTFFLYVR